MEQGEQREEEKGQQKPGQGVFPSVCAKSFQGGHFLIFDI